MARTEPLDQRSSLSVPERLLLVTSNFGGGTGSHLVGMLEHLSPELWQVEILCQAKKELEPPDHVRLLEASRYGRLDRFPIAQWRRLRHVRRLVRAWNPRLVHTYFFWPILYGRVLKKLGSVRRLVENREDQGFNMTSWNYEILRRTAHLPDRVICVSEAVRQVVVEREGVEAERTVVIHNGVEVPSSDFARDDLESTRKEIGFSPSHFIVGMVSNLNRAVKGVHYFLEAMPIILAEVPAARFLILGGGLDEINLKAKARELGVQDHVCFAGFRPDPERFYPIMDVSVLTSLSEGLSMTILESMSFRRPVVATRVGGNPELVVEGVTGYLVPARDPAAFAAQVTKLLRNEQLRSRMGEAGRRRVEKYFTLADTARKYQNVYSELL